LLRNLVKRLLRSGFSERKLVSARGYRVVLDRSLTSVQDWIARRAMNFLSPQDAK